MVIAPVSLSKLRLFAPGLVRVREVTIGTDAVTLQLMVKLVVATAVILMEVPFSCSSPLCEKIGPTVETAITVKLND